MGTLSRIVREEPCFRIQIFSMETVEFFGSILNSLGIQHSKQFSSSYRPAEAVVLLIRDSPLPDLPQDSKILLYSNVREVSFIPYRFRVEEEQKALLLAPAELQLRSRNEAVSAAFFSNIDIHRYTANSLNHTQCIILFCMIRERSFTRLCTEIRAVDSSLDNTFRIKCELNAMVKHGICKKHRSRYSIAISRQTVQRVCERAGFRHALAH